MANLSQQEDFELADTLLDHLLGFLHHMRSNGFHLGIQEELDVMKMAESGEDLDILSWPSLSPPSMWCDRMMGLRRFGLSFSA